MPKSYWWANPQKLTLLLLLPIFLLISHDLLISKKITKFAIPIYYDIESFSVSLVSLIAFSFSAWIGQHALQSSTHTTQRFLVDERALITYGITALVSGAVISKHVILNPSVIAQYFAGDFSAFYLKTLAGNIPGITSLSQLGIIFVSIYALETTNGRRYHNPRLLKFILFLIIIFSILRATFYAERLAILEVLIPYFLVKINKQSDKHNAALRIFFRAAPLTGFLALYIIFIGAEYNRSWRNYYINHFDSIFEFGLTRLSLYYSTALNNGALIVNHGETNFLQYTMEWLHKFPILGSFLNNGIDNSNYDQILRSYADPEFNNPSGLLTYYADLGVFVFPFFSIIGLLYGFAFRCFNISSNRFAFIYPCFYIAILEVLRIPYITSSRAFVLVLGVALLTFLQKKHPPPLRNSCANISTKIEHCEIH